VGRDEAQEEALASYGQGSRICVEHTAILDVGAGKDSVARQIWGKDARNVVTTLDVRPEAGPDVVADITEPLPGELVGAFDIVLAHHVLEHIPLKLVPRVLGNMAAALKAGGMLHVFVPSLEWASEQVLDTENASEVLLYHLYGSQENEAMFHRSGFTIPILRPLLEKAGLSVRLARIEPYAITVLESGATKATPHEAGQIHLMGVKRVQTE